MTILRTATSADIPALSSLIESSARELSVGFYTPEQIEAAVTHILIEEDHEPVAAGGWSARRTLYGGDRMKDAEDPRLDPAVDAARIRAFFVHPRWARRGLARQLYAECARAAWTAGFRSFELIATSPGEPLYTALGFSVLERDAVHVAGVAIPFARMRRQIPRPDSDGAS